MKAVGLKQFRKRHPHRSKKTVDGLYEALAPGSTVKKVEKNTLVIREPGQLNVTVRNSDIAKLGTRDECVANVSEYDIRRGPRLLTRTSEARITTHTKELYEI